jgi:hypothetical protein
MSKEFEELLLNNTLLKVQYQALGDKNLKWKEWWQMMQEHIEANPRKYGVSPSGWIDLPIGIVVEQHFAQGPKLGFGR